MSDAGITGITDITERESIYMFVHQSLELLSLSHSANIQNRFGDRILKEKEEVKEEEAYDTSCRRKR